MRCKELRYVIVCVGGGGLNFHVPAKRDGAHLSNGALVMYLDNSVVDLFQNSLEGFQKYLSELLGIFPWNCIY